MLELAKTKRFASMHHIRLLGKPEGCMLDEIHIGALFRQSLGRPPSIIFGALPTRPLTN
jgi:hypothetical protein